MDTLGHLKLQLQFVIHPTSELIIKPLQFYSWLPFSQLICNWSGGFIALIHTGENEKR